MRYITFSRAFPAYHPKKGLDTFFPEMILNAIGVQSPHDVPEVFKPLVNDFAMLERSKKYHTIRAGNRWKAGDWFSPRVWSGKPYQSKQIEFAPPIQVKKVWRVEINNRGGKAWFEVLIDDKIFARLHHGNDKDENLSGIERLASNDGLELNDFMFWFNTLPFTGQIICWNENINY